MKKLFENTTTYTQETYMEFVNFHNKKYNPSYIAYTVFWSFLLLLCIILAFGSGARIQGVVITIILITFIIYRLVRPKLAVEKELESDKISAKNSNTFSFYDKEFVISNKKGKFNFRYFMLHKIFETPSYFYLYVSKENAFLLSKMSFSLGTSEEFSKFIKSKCSLKYRLQK